MQERTLCAIIWSLHVCTQVHAYMCTLQTYILTNKKLKKFNFNHHQMIQLIYAYLWGICLYMFMHMCMTAYPCVCMYLCAIHVFLNCFSPFFSLFVVCVFVWGVFGGQKENQLIPSTTWVLGVELILTGLVASTFTH